MSNQRHIFLSYSSVEVDFALKLAADLKNAGLNLWIDRLDIKLGDDWRRSLQNAVDDCAALIAVLTPEYVASRYCQRELARADRFGHPIFPLLLHPIADTDWPLEVEREQYINFSHWRDPEDYQQRLGELINRFREHFSEQFSDAPDAETRYLTTLVAELEASRGVMEYVELSHQANKVLSEEMLVRPQPRFAAAWTMEGSFSVVPEFADIPVRPLRARVALRGIADAVERYSRFVLIGAPGTGKTTTIQHLVLSAAYARLENPSGCPLPYFLKLTNWHEEETPEAFIRNQWPLPGDPITLMAEGKVTLYLDGLNEMGPQGELRAQKLRDWIASSRAPKHLIVTCRASEYSDALNLRLPTVQTADMDQSRIQQFVRSYLDDGAAERLLDKILPDETRSNDNARHLFQLARNPFLLSILVLVFMRSPDGELPQNKGTLLKELAAELWHQESLRQQTATQNYETLERALANLAFSMVDAGMPVYVTRDYALQQLGNPDLLKLGIRAKFLEEEGATVRFSHQLMQEYFAALGLARKGLPTRLAQANISPSGQRIAGKWDAVIIALCGVAPTPDTIIRTVAEVDPFLALECVASGVRVVEATREMAVTHVLSAIHQKSHIGRVVAASLLHQIDHEAALPVMLAAMRDGPWEARITAYELFRQTWLPEFPGLIEALHESSLTMREATATALVQIGAAVLPNLLQLLRDENWATRRGAAWGLGEMRDAAAVPALVEVLSDADGLVGAEAAIALGLIRDGSAVAALADAMYTGSWRVRYAAAAALGWIGDRGAMTELLKALGSDDENMRCLSIEGLKYISNPAVHSALLQASYDESSEVRGAVIEALKDTEDARAVNRLIELLTDMSLVKSAKARVSDIAARVLEASGVRKAITAVEQWRSGQAKTPAKAGAASKQTAMTAKSSRDTGKGRLLSDLKGTKTAQSAGEYANLDSPDWMVRRKAVRELANVELSTALPKLINKLEQDEDSQVRLAAVQVLGGIDNEVVTEGLITALGDSDALVCDAATQALAAQGKKVVGALITALTNSNVNVRGGAVEALAKIGDKSAVQPLTALLTDIAQPWLAEHRICDLAGRALLSIGTPDARAAVKKWRETPLGKTFIERANPRPQVVAEPEPEVRVRPTDDPLLELLFDLHDAEWGKREETAKRLREYARTLKGKDVALDVQRLVGAVQDEDWFVRWAAADALAWIGDKSAVPHIMKLLSDDNWTVRIGAVRDLAELQDAAALPALVALAEDTNHNVREVVAEAIGVLGGPDSVDTLIKLAEDDERFVRFSAIEALRKVGNEKAHAPLVQALRDEHVTVRRAAVEAVRALQIQSAVPTLIELLQDTQGLDWEDDRICDLAAVALEQIGTSEAKAAASEWRRSQPEMQ